MKNFGEVPPKNGLQPPRSLKSALWRLPGAPWGRPFEGGPNGQRGEVKGRVKGLGFRVGFRV